MKKLYFPPVLKSISLRATNVFLATSTIGTTDFESEILEFDD